ncbi:B-cell antigen receptor complex-associated protein alpha chain [Toxotes jaculatrix]|uniref:B-cell antigen receptor complex-associated protein alpha chain n=1 Tax=Toxotes jaculatrix TaxID=941984 RepID=UPI001B3AB90F|nr:B-cell antigen receptor complex-associated protein alpha chain [Toxotes jaculatrix]
MGIATIVVFCSFAVGIAQSALTLMADQPFLSVPLSEKAEMKCCYNNNVTSVEPLWVRRFKNANNASVDFVTPSVSVISDHIKKDHTFCGILKLNSVELNDSGLYHCSLNSSKGSLLSHGTYLHVYKPMKKTLNLSESTKNKILTAEGILLLLCVILPSATLLCKSKKIREIEKKKVKTEEENIYQGLNLEDCCTTYDQIERSQGHGPYQDVCNIMEEEEEIQLEKP